MALSFGNDSDENKEFEQEQDDEKWSDVDEFEQEYIENAPNTHIKIQNEKKWKCTTCNNVNSLVNYTI